MSQPTRYDAADLRCKKCQKNVDFFGVLRSHDEGRFVMWDDYAALAADKEAETKAVFDAIRLITQLRDENARLKSENNRLRRAGDGLMFEGETMAHEVSWNPAPWDRVVAAWVAAKGVQP